MRATTEISVVCPVYGCNQCLPTLCERTIKTLSKITDQFEIILVNDGCPQNSWATILELCDFDARIKGINLSRNFGQHYAITAGLDYVQGEWIVVMDCDLQDQPEEIIKLYQKAQEGSDIVVGQRVNRSDSFLKRCASKLFYVILEYFTDVKHDGTVANFGIYSKKVIQSVLIYREQNRAFPLLIHLVGFKKTSIPIEHAKRDEGKSSYTLIKMINLAIDSIVTHSNKPLRLSVNLGLFISLSSIIYAGILVARYFLYAVPVQGWTSVMVAMFFMFGMLFGILGILGLYIGKIFNEAKNRPLYLVQEKINFCGE
jgi:polyisoprenyl-phosphate glycosyltransferase